MCDDLFANGTMASHPHRCNGLKTSMLTSGAWAADDDERLLGALLEGKYKEVGQVPWGQLVAGRDAATARRRWQLLLQNPGVPKHRGLELPDCVAMMVQHCCPRLWGLHAGVAEVEGG